MNSIEIVNNNGQIVTSSRQVADNFSKRHNNVLRDIDLILEGMLKIEDTQNLFYKTEYVHEQNNQTYPEYLMNRDGFTLLAMGFTGVDAMQWKLKYIKAFNDMEAAQNKPMTLDEMMLHQLKSVMSLKEDVIRIDTEIAGIKLLLPTAQIIQERALPDWGSVIATGLKQLLASGEYYLEGLRGHLGTTHCNNATCIGTICSDTNGTKIQVFATEFSKCLARIGIALPTTKVLASCGAITPSKKTASHVIKYYGASLRVLQLNVDVAL